LDIVIYVIVRLIDKKLPLTPYFIIRSLDAFAELKNHPC